MPQQQEIDIKEIESRVVKLINEILPEVKEELTSTTDLTLQYGLDSLDIVELVMEVEGEFEICIEDDKLLDAVYLNKGVVTPNILISIVHKTLTK